jgi:hypothetical protein
MGLPGMSTAAACGSVLYDIENGGGDLESMMKEMRLTAGEANLLWYNELASIGFTLGYFHHTLRIASKKPVKDGMGWIGHILLQSVLPGRFPSRLLLNFI